jgi:predicted secreted Zn-dependent protease
MGAFVPGRLLLSYSIVKSFKRHGILILLACALLPVAAHAKIHEDRVYAYYEVKARPDQPLYAQLYAASPIKEDGQTLHGFTNWELQWKLEMSTDKSGLCRIIRATTNLRVVTTLPKLDGANTQQAADFDRYLSALRHHELGHYRIAEQAARTIEHKLRTLKAMRNCDTLGTYANASARRTLAHFNEKSRRYDRETSHGQKQGAWLDN